MPMTYARVAAVLTGVHAAGFGLSTIPVALLWLSVPLGIAALAILISARTRIPRSGSKLLTVGFVLAVVGTLIVASIAFQVFSRALNESI
jgi:hypothetical protein